MYDQTKQITNRLWVLGIVSTVVYAVILKLSFSFEQGSVAVDRPILGVLGLIGLAFLAYFAGCFLVFRKGTPTTEVQPVRRRFVEPIDVIFIFGILFRLILLFSVPIQEVDIYRYVWDGLTANQGVDPYTYPPEVVKSDLGRDFKFSEGVSPAGANKDLDNLVRLVTDNAGAREVLDRVHFGGLSTPYPPVSQFVFRLATRSVPESSSVETFVFVMKVTIVLFDIATAFMIVFLLRICRLPTVWSIAYLWCPLVLKEFANSGHLDSIAVFLCTAAIVATLQGLSSLPDLATETHRQNLRCLIWFSIAAIFLSFSVGAKLYPLIVFPLWACTCIRRSPLRGIFAVSLLLVVSAFVCWPMARHTDVAKKYYSSVVPTFVQNHFELAEKKEDKIHTNTGVVYLYEPSGIESFLKSWEMNDLLFMVVVENLKLPRPTMPGQTRPPEPWFSVLDLDTRESISKTVEEWTGKKQRAFWIARRLTLLVFAMIVLWSCISIMRKCEPVHFCRLTFLTLAWFWLLLPTQNPWYWTWALPLVVFARSRIWLLVAAATMLYYLRFYFEYNFADEFVLGTPYTGTYFFDFVVPWIEFAPLLILLLIERVLPRKSPPLCRDVPNPD